MVEIGSVIFCILAAYAALLYQITGRDRGGDGLVWSFMSVALTGFVYHMYLFSFIAECGYVQFDNVLSEMLFSAQYSLEMFIANTIIFRGEVVSTLRDYPYLFYVYLPIYGMALLTSGFAIFHFLSRKLYNWLWLTFHRRSAKRRKYHIFIGVNNQSCTLAEDILTPKSEERVMLIDLPDGNDKPRGISVWDIISRFFGDDKEKLNLKDYVVLRADKGLRKLLPWLKEENNCVYILSDNQSANLEILVKLWERSDIKCKIYCHAKKEGLISRYDNLADEKDRITFVDSSLLAVECLKKDGTGKLLPVNFVNIAQDDVSGQRLGYVTSSFNCAVIGFGETGKEAFKFLYEFGAFPDKDNAKAPFMCHIFDDNIDEEVGGFGVELESLRSSAAKDNEVKLHSCRVGSKTFIAQMKEIICGLNYIVICLGNDDLNLETALNVVELAELGGRSTADKLCVLVKQSWISKLNQKTLDNANLAYNNCIHTFGMLDSVWKKQIVSNEDLKSDARVFFDSYTALSKQHNDKNKYGKPDTWEERDEKICSPNYGCRCKARRQRAQDFSNCMHMTTKRMLCKPCDGLAESIYLVNVGEVHCGELGKEILEHLAVCEHLRWEASHMMLGYRFTCGNTDDKKKVHNCMKPYKEIDPVTQHFDWLVVKNSLS